MTHWVQGNTYTLIDSLSITFYMSFYFSDDIVWLLILSLVLLSSVVGFVDASVHYHDYADHRFVFLRTFCWLVATCAAKGFQITIPNFEIGTKQLEHATGGVGQLLTSGCVDLMYCETARRRSILIYNPSYWCTRLVVQIRAALSAWCQPVISDDNAKTLEDRDIYAGPPHTFLPTQDSTHIYLCLTEILQVIDKPFVTLPPGLRVIYRHISICMWLKRRPTSMVLPQRALPPNLELLQYSYLGAPLSLLSPV